MSHRYGRRHFNDSRSDCGVGAVNQFRIAHAVHVFRVAGAQDGAPETAQRSAEEPDSDATTLACPRCVTLSSVTFMYANDNLSEGAPLGDLLQRNASVLDRMD